MRLIMKQRDIRPISKKEAQDFAITVLEHTYGATVKNIKYVGGGSFGFVYKVEIDKEPFTIIMKACRTGGICEREANELTLLGSDSLVKIPKVYFTFLATPEIPIDFIGMEFVEGTNCFTDFAKLLKSKKTKESVFIR